MSHLTVTNSPLSQIEHVTMVPQAARTATHPATYKALCGKRMAEAHICSTGRTRLDLGSCSHYKNGRVLSRIVGGHWTDTAWKGKGLGPEGGRTGQGSFGQCQGILGPCQGTCPLPKGSPCCICCAPDPCQPSLCIPSTFPGGLRRCTRMMQGCDKDPWGIPVASKLRGSVWGFPCRSLQHPSARLDRRMLSCIPETSLCNLYTHTNNILHTSLPCPACFCHASHTQLTQTLQHDHRNKAGCLRMSTHGLRHAC